MGKKEDQVAAIKERLADPTISAEVFDELMWRLKQLEKQRG